PGNCNTMVYRGRTTERLTSSKILARARHCKSRHCEAHLVCDGSHSPAFAKSSAVGFCSVLQWRSQQGLQCTFAGQKLLANRPQLKLSCSAPTILKLQSMATTRVSGRRVPWCGNTRLLSPVTAQEFQFLSSHRSNRDLLVYSAFYDPRLAPRKPIIRSTGIARNVGMSGLMCQLWYRRWSQVMVTMQAHVERLPEGDSRRYQAVLITCSTSSKVEEIPSAVSFAWSHCAQPAGFLPVRVLPSTPVRNGQFAVCMSPLHSSYDNVDEAVQTLELNRLFGANRFFVYSFASSKRVASLLASKHYAKDVTVLPFQPPVNVDRWPQPSNYTVEVKHFAQMAMLQDCVMRASAKYEFAVFTDMNEVVVPRSKGLSNWRDLVRARMSDNKTAGLSLQHADFWLEWPADSE
uniref:Glycosyltransferase family 92 protein n=1 Tax=Macrostomum lignano TaxID=282301 RepID=A0A1I8J4J4_9PLAT